MRNERLDFEIRQMAVQRTRSAEIWTTQRASHRNMELSAGFRNGLPRGASPSPAAAAAAAAAFLSFLGDAAAPLLAAAGDGAASSAFLARLKSFIF